MADRRFTLVLYVAIATAAAATFGVYRVLQNTKEQARIPMRPIVLAALDIPEGTTLSREALVVKQWPVATVPAGAFANPDSLVGRVTRVAVFNGEALVPGRLTPLGTSGGIEVKIAPGKRAIAIRINDVAGVAGLVQPNSRVDVLLALNVDPGTGQTQQVAKLYMENMKVLSIGQQIERGPDGRPITAPTATLEVTPQEAERLVTAQNLGNIQLVLRGYGETDSVKTRGSAASDVFAQIRGDRPQEVKVTPRREEPRRSAPAPAPRVVAQQVASPLPVAAPPAPKAPDSVTIQVYRGSTVSHLKLQADSTKKTP
jgi:pilus assembly protein CpaB